MSKAGFGREVDDRLSSLDQVDVVVETDGHLQDTLDSILPYVDDEYAEFKEFVEQSPAPGLEMNATTTPSPLYQYEHRKEAEGRDAYFFVDERPIDELADLMDEIGIDKAIANNLGGSPIKGERLVPGYINGTNNWLLEQFGRYDHIVGNMAISHHGAINQMAEEIDRLASEKSIVGIQFFGTPINPSPGDRKYDPIYRAAERHGLPISIHTGTGNRGWPEQFWWSQTYAEDHVYEHPFSHMSNIASMVLNGVTERFPDLDFLCQEAGIGYVPYLLERMDTAYETMGHDLPQLEKRPSEYVDDSIYFATQPLGHTGTHPDQIAWTVDMIGPENVVFSSDSPHPDFDTPEELFDRIRHYFEADEINAIMGQNAEELFGL